MDKKKLTTADILALARKQDGQGGGPAGAEAPAESAPEPAQPETTPATPAGEKPTSTADILAAARAQGGGAAATPKTKAAAESSTPSAKPAAPKSTADILAAARAEGSGSKPAGETSARPKSTADILAAARAQGKGAAPAAKPAAAATRPAAAKPAAAKPAAPAGDRPSVQEMLAAVRKGSDASTAAKPATPKLPAKRTVPPRGAGKGMPRRSFLASTGDLLLMPFSIGWLLVGAIGAIWSLAAARFMMPNMVVELPSRFKVGPPSDYPPGTVSEKFKAARGIWVVHTDQYNGQNLIYALSTVCTHLGCTPNWLQAEQKFKCPCHGSGFYINGINFEGPAPRPLERVGIGLAEDGMLEVDKSLTFQEELGQWADPASFYEPV
ncbi:MAG: Rieske 2Fe-2S domain-containing protein [Maioricimonas sp. JB049]